MPDLKNFIVVCGHYGCGKTNFSINLALEYAARGEQVTVADLDLVNPYFRTSDYRKILEDKGIEVVAPVFAASNLDIPSLPARMYSIFESKGRVIVDVGGDDVGATVLGRFYKQLSATDHDMLYVVNRFRSMTTRPSEAVEIMNEIVSVTGQRFTGIVNNSHLMEYTDREKLSEGRSFAVKVSEDIGIPIVCNTVRRDLIDSCSDVFEDKDSIYPIDIYVKTVWN